MDEAERKLKEMGNCVIILVTGNSPVVVKRFKKEYSTVLEEIKMHRELGDVPGVVSFLGQESGPIGLKMEHCNGGSLKDFIRGLERPLEEEQILRLFTSMMETVRELHRRRYVHRALTCHNWLIQHSQGDLKVKLSDFGLAKTITQGESLNSHTIFNDEGKREGYSNSIFAHDAAVLGQTFLFMVRPNQQPQGKNLTLQAVESLCAAAAYSSKVAHIVASLIVLNLLPTEEELARTDIWQGLEARSQRPRIPVCDLCMYCEEQLTRLPCAHTACVRCGGEKDSSYCRLCRTSETQQSQEFQESTMEPNSDFDDLLP